MGKVEIVIHRPKECNKLGWYRDHVGSYQNISKEQAEVVLLGDSLVLIPNCVGSPSGESKCCQLWYPW